MITLSNSKIINSWRINTASWEKGIVNKEIESQTQVINEAINYQILKHQLMLVFIVIDNGALDDKK